MHVNVSRIPILNPSNIGKSSYTLPRTYIQTHSPTEEKCHALYGEKEAEHEGRKAVYLDYPRGCAGEHGSISSLTLVSFLL